MIKEFSRPFLLYNGNSCPSKRSSWQVGIGSGNGLALPSTSGDKDLQCNGILLLLARLQWVKAIYANLNHLLNRPKCAASSWLYSSKIQGFLRIGMCYSVWVYLIRIISRHCTTWCPHATPWTGINWLILQHSKLCGMRIKTGGDTTIQCAVCIPVYW